LQFDRQTVDAIAQTGWLGPVVKNMSQMRSTRFAYYFRAQHTVRVIPYFLYHLVIRRRKEAGPTTTCIKFAVRKKQSLTTASTAVNTLLSTVPVFTAKRPLGALFATHMKFLWSQFVTPYLIVVHCTVLAGID
jgi:hypothetical protein